MSQPKSNEEIVEELLKEAKNDFDLAKASAGREVSFSYWFIEEVTKALAQKDAEIAEMLHKLHLCAIGKYEGDALENVKAQIKEFQTTPKD